MKKILAVDDEEDILYSLKYGLEKISNEYEIQTAKDGVQCLDILKKEIPDLILLDLMMPNMSGWKVLETIQENPKWRHIPIFIVTAFKDPEFKKSSEELGITYIEKPFTIDGIKIKIDKFFNK